MSLATARLLVGRTIAAVDLRPFPDGRGGTAHNPRITLDNGAVVTFVVDETNIGEYGVTPCYHPRRRVGRGAKL